ncbi:MAG: SIR2 family NAD-dependent protein deacylase [Actinomycetes bacterium]|jgi:NAD-dependent deacetylase|nr:Sir2 family NAD-dependent protein deacetylase [Actinomycetes bacterium]
MTADQAEQAEQQVASWLRAADRVTVLSGAGISTESGIPDFRGPQGVWTKDPAAAALFTFQNYLADPQVRVRSWRARRDSPAWQAEPNAGHRALVDLERAGKLRALITQNIDELHQLAGSDPALVIELHGTMRWATCLECGLRTPMPEVLTRVAGGETDPPCLRCGGIQKSATISFGQSLDADVLAAAVRAARDCVLFLAVGTSLQVYPAAGLCDHAVASGARLAVINAEPTPYDDASDAVLRAPIGVVLPRLVATALS